MCKMMLVRFQFAYDLERKQKKYHMSDNIVDFIE
ncbi:Uncharacterized protein BM_BM14253 [Brugia malayi]|nr:Uncharacterized protein BM_BM14253 [Brugia malayi]VIO91279.1 Uncharacterized protein BM_BM14253 [Brugia malayi]